MPNCNICGRPIDSGERVAFHNNGTCHFRCLPKEDQEELGGLINLRGEMKSGKSKTEILRGLQELDKERTEEEKREDEEDTTELRKLQEMRSKMKEAAASKNKEEARRHQLDILETLEPGSRKEIESIQEEKCAKCGKPASNIIDGKYYCVEHSYGKFEGTTISKRPPPPPRIISVGPSPQKPTLPPMIALPKPSRPLPAIGRLPTVREQPPLFEFSSVKEVKCPFCGSSQFLKVIARHGMEIEYECENPACT